MEVIKNMYRKLGEMFSYIFSVTTIDDLYDPDATSISEDEDKPLVKGGSALLYTELVTEVRIKGEIHYNYRDFVGPYNEFINYLKSINSYNENDLKRAIDSIRVSSKRMNDELLGK